MERGRWNGAAAAIRRPPDGECPRYQWTNRRPGSYPDESSPSAGGPEDGPGAKEGALEGWVPVNRTIAQCVSAALAPALIGAAASGETFFFDGIVTSDSEIGDIIIGETQLSVDVTMPSADLVEFLISNEGDSASSVTGVYWDDRNDRLGEILNSLTGEGVAFTEGGAPPVLPGGAEVGFMEDRRVNALAPPPMQGINPGESLLVRFALADLTELFGEPVDVISEVRTGQLRVGVHVQSFPGGGSESFVTRSEIIPAPQAIGLASAGLCLMAMGLRRRWTV